MSTKLLYLDDFTGLEAEAVVVDMSEENGRSVVVLDRTIFYPQGGGQSYDQGVITSSSSARFIVDEVRFVEGIVKHIGKFSSGTFQKGDAVKLFVDVQRRNLNSALHSAGHLVDMAVYMLKLGWTPVKGYHFPNGSYVEYSGSIDDSEKESIKGDIEIMCNKLVGEGRGVAARFMDKAEMSSVCHFVPDYIPEGKPSRVVMFGDFGVPCGGTHVRNISELKDMVIRKIKNGQTLRVVYDLERNLK